MICFHYFKHTASLLTMAGNYSQLLVEYSWLNGISTDAKKKEKRKVPFCSIAAFKMRECANKSPLVTELKSREASFCS